MEPENYDNPLYESFSSINTCTFIIMTSFLALRRFSRPHVFETVYAAVH